MEATCCWPRQPHRSALTTDQAPPPLPPPPHCYLQKAGRFAMLQTAGRKVAVHWYWELPWELMDRSPTKQPKRRNVSLATASPCSRHHLMPFHSSNHPPTIVKVKNLHGWWTQAADIPAKGLPTFYSPFCCCCLTWLLVMQQLKWAMWWNKTKIAGLLQKKKKMERE